MSKIQKSDYLIFDIEVFPNWWLIVFKYYHGFWRIVSSDDYKIFDILRLINDKILVGFNCKNYDLKILNAIMHDNTPQQIYELSKSIINDSPHQYNNFYYWNSYKFIDLYDDWKNGTLKEFESNIGMSIEESEISFNKEDLSDYDKHLTINYCSHDVEATERLLDIREAYVFSKIKLAELFDINVYKALKSTNAKLAATILGAVKINRPLNNKYVIPEKIHKYLQENLPQDVIDLFKILSKEAKEIELFENKIKFGIGGIHSVYSDCLFTTTDENYKLINVDVTSYYPNLLMYFAYMSRNVSNPEKYKEIYKMRKDYKRKMQQERDTNGKTSLFWEYYYIQYGLKLILNTVYGAMKNQYNDLYDWTNAGSLCYTGQLALAALANKIYNTIPNIKIIQTNTDGILVKCPRDQEDVLHKLVEEWETMMEFTMEFDDVNCFFQRDVNNYIECTGNNNDPYKLKGKWANQAFTEDLLTNLNAPIVHQALLKFYTEKIPIEKTINECNDPLLFCFTTKTGHTYDRTYYKKNNKLESTNKVNRVYASTNKLLGTIYKYKLINEPDYIKECFDKYKDEKHLNAAIKLRQKRIDIWYKTYPNVPFGKLDKIAEISENVNLMNDKLYLPSDLDRDWYVQFCKNKVKELTYV